jgi:hypothetical protein
VDGLRLPHRIIKTARGVTFEDIRLEKIAEPNATRRTFETDLLRGCVDCNGGLLSGLVGEPMHHVSRTL